MTSDVELLAYDGDIDRVREVGMEEGGDVAVGEQFLDLVGGGIGRSHVGR